MASAPGFWLSWPSDTSPCRHRVPTARHLTLHVFDFLMGGAHVCLGEVLSHGW